jgi:formiminotetrahydrofolate cyclodeaminase
MGVSTKLSELSLAEFSRAAASRAPAPGSGSVAALLGALGSSLASMALGATTGEDELARLRESLLALVDRDAEAYRAFLDAPPDERGSALARAAEVPAEIARQSLTALEILARGLPRVRTILRCECSTAAGALLAAVEGAVETARANLQACGAAAGRDAELADLARCARELLVRIRSQVQPGA